MMEKKLIDINSYDILSINIYRDESSRFMATVRFLDKDSEKAIFIPYLFFDRHDDLCLTINENTTRNDLYSDRVVEFEISMKALLARDEDGYIKIQS